MSEPLHLSRSSDEAFAAVIFNQALPAEFESASADKQIPESVCIPI